MKMPYFQQLVCKQYSLASLSYKEINQKEREIQFFEEPFFNHFAFDFVQCGPEDTGEGNVSSVVRRYIGREINR